MGWESWEPYMYRDQEGMLTGLDIEVIQQVAREINCRVEFIETPFKRHLIELKKGNIDLASSTQYKDDRAEYARFTIPYRTSRYSLIVRRGELDKYPFETFDEFKNSGIRLGITRGYLYGDRMASVIAKSSGNLDIEDVVAESINLRKLMVNRIDAFLADPVVIQKVAEEDENTDSFAVHPLHIHSTTFHFISSRQSVPKDLADKINNALIKLDNDGWIEKLTLKYHRIDE
ncbi:substrate-binding periplasmic protein [Hahella ganghwensis]|uniref:substrate-binding periplasmic protein n=1 Tax=Hahella ganghwensis TaxID=286420 RepID=UPI002480C955|nr:transporter substrate-binding domain-containing protein [Hahella ganghwensis]